MCDHQHRARVVGQERLQPLDGVDVQVVRRLIKEEHIGGRHQRARQHHPSAPPAREAAERARRPAAADARAPSRRAVPAAIRPVLRARAGGDPFRRARWAARVPPRLSRDGRRRPGHSDPRALRPPPRTRWSRRRAARPVPVARCPTPGALHTVPRSGSSSPDTMRRSVDFPLPFLPISATRSPRSSCNETSSSSGTWPKAWPTWSRLRRRHEALGYSQGFRPRSGLQAEARNAGLTAASQERDKASLRWLTQTCRRTACPATEWSWWKTSPTWAASSN